MTNVHTVCTDCGVIELSARNIVLVLGADGSTGHYSFACPGCGNIQERPADHRRVGLLLAAQVVYQITPTIDPITEDEILDFADGLHTSGWYAELGDG